MEIFISITDLYNTTVDGWSCHLPNRNKTRLYVYDGSSMQMEDLEVTYASIAHWKARKRLPICHN